MKVNTASEAAIATIEALEEVGMVAFLLYYDANGWHMAGRKIEPQVMADALRSLADEIECKGDRVLN